MILAVLALILFPVTARAADPVAANASYETTPGSDLPVNLVATDADSDPLDFIIVALPSIGTVTVGASTLGTGDLPYTIPSQGKLLTFSAGTGDHGTASIQFKANDGGGDSNTAIVSIQVNAAPTASDAAVSVEPGNDLEIALTGSDADGDALSYIIVSPLPSFGDVTADGATLTTGDLPYTLTGSGDTVTYTAGADDHGDAEIVFMVNDSYEDSETATVTVTVNTAPAASDLSVTVEPGQTKVITLDASDADEDALDYIVTSPLPSLGTLSIGGTVLTSNDLPFAIPAQGKNLTFTADQDASGTATISYKVNDGVADSAGASVSVLVNAPPAAEDASYTVAPSEALEISLAATDADADTMSYVIVSPLPVLGAVSAGGVTLTADDLPYTIAAQGNTITYTAAADGHGADTILFKADDGVVESVTAAVTVMVNQAPTASAGSVVTSPGSSASIVLTASDPDNDPLSYTVVAPLPSAGELQVGGVTLAADDLPYTLPGNGNAVTYVAPTDGSGTVSVKFTASDGTAASSAQTVNIKINRTPSAQAAAYIMEPGAQQSITLVGSDPDGDTLSYVIASPLPAKGQVQVGGTVLSSSHVPHTIPAAGRTLTFTADTQAHGTAELRFFVTDGDADSDEVVVSLTINQGPGAVDASYVVEPRAVQAITLAGTDPDNDTLTYTIASPLPDAGTLSISGHTLSSDELPYTLSGSSRTVTYTAGEQTGSASISFQVSDGVATSALGTVTIMINSTPMADGASYTVEPGSSVTLSLGGTDADDDALTYTVLDPLPSMGELAVGSTTLTAGDLPYTLEGGASDLTFTAELHTHGSTAVNFRAADDMSTSPEATVIVTVNQKPAADEGTAVVGPGNSKEITLTGSDPDNDALSYVLINPLPAMATVKVGSVTLDASDMPYTLPNQGQRVSLIADATAVGTDELRFHVTDGYDDSAEATVAITYNSGPAANSTTTFTLEPDTELQIDLPVTDPDEDAMTATIISLPGHGLLTVGSATVLDGMLPYATDSTTVAYIPDPSFHGQDKFTFTASDGNADSPVITVTLEVNTAPTVTDVAETVLPDGAVDVVLKGVDIDRDPLVYEILSLPVNGSLVIDELVLTGTELPYALPENGKQVRYLVNEGYLGADSFHYRVKDSITASARGVVSITVNNPPVAGGGICTMPKDTAYEGALNATDDDGDAIQMRIVSLPTQGTLTVGGQAVADTAMLIEMSSGSTTFTYAPNEGFEGTDTFSWLANDGLEDSAVAQVSLVVGTVPDDGEGDDDDEVAGDNEPPPDNTPDPGPPPAACAPMGGGAVLMTMAWALFIGGRASSRRLRFALSAK